MRDEDSAGGASRPFRVVREEVTEAFVAVGVLLGAERHWNMFDRVEGTCADVAHYIQHFAEAFLLLAGLPTAKGVSFISGEGGDDH